MKLSPIIIFTFNRLDHTRQTIEALKHNNLAEKSDVFIFSDAGRNDKEIKKVNAVREYIKSISGFKSIKIIEANENKGLAKSIIEGVTEIINEYGKVIVLEDDLVTSKYFLEYMNEALNVYEKRKDIWSISGYMPNIEIPKEYSYEVCLIKRGSSWGWATWADRWKLNDWNVADYNQFKTNKVKIKKFNESGGDLSYMLEDQMKGRINSWAIRWVYSQYKHDMWTVYPVKSFVKNIGNDLSGTHSSRTNKYETNLIDYMISIEKNIKEDSKIIYSFKKMYDLNISEYIAILIKKIGLYKPARKIRNNILNALNRKVR